MWWNEWHLMINHRGYFSILNVIHPWMPTFFYFSRQREAIRTEVKDPVTGMLKGSWKDRKEMEIMFCSACLRTCKLELMYFQWNQPLPKISQDRGFYLSCNLVQYWCNGRATRLTKFCGARRSVFYLNMWSFVKKTTFYFFFFTFYLQTNHNYSNKTMVARS